MRVFAILTLVVSLSACSGAPSQSPPDGNPALLDLWAGYDDAYAARTAEDIPCAETLGTWFEDFGIRGIACVTSAIASPSALVQRAGRSPFLSGPHATTDKSIRLDLNSEYDFGRYDPAFVEWIIEEGIVGEGRPAVRALTQPVYDRYLKRIARVYWVTQADMIADGFPYTTPAGVLSDYATFLETGEAVPGAEGYEGGFSVFHFTDLSDGVIGRADPTYVGSWSAKYEANTAFGFWMRRRADGTLAQWQDGLRRLLATYDAPWLSTQDG